jgi:hypothetical protein
MKSVLFGMTAAASLPALVVIATSASAAMPGPVNSTMAPVRENPQSGLTAINLLYNAQGHERAVRQPGDGGPQPQAFVNRPTIAFGKQKAATSGHSLSGFAYNLVRLVSRTFGCRD